MTSRKIYDKFIFAEAKQLAWHFVFNCKQSENGYKIVFLLSLSHLQFSSGTQLCSTLCDPMDCNMPGFPVHPQLLDPAQNHVHQVGDVVQPSHHNLQTLISHTASQCFYTENEMVGFHHRLQGRESEQVLGDSEGHGSLACCSPWDHRVGHN